MTKRVSALTGIPKLYMANNTQKSKAHPRLRFFTKVPDTGAPSMYTDWPKGPSWPFVANSSLVPDVPCVLGEYEGPGLPESYAGGNPEPGDEGTAWPGDCSAVLKSSGGGLLL